MATYLLDTNVIIDAVNGKKGRNEFLLDLTELQGHTLATCPVNVAEVYAGMRPKEAQRTAELLHSLELLPITFSVAALAGGLKYDYARKGITLSLADAMIAAVAIHYQLRLITGNAKHFPMKELSLYPLPD